MSRSTRWRAADAKRAKKTDEKEKLGVKIDQMANKSVQPKNEVMRLISDKIAKLVSKAFCTVYRAPVPAGCGVAIPVRGASDICLSGA